MRNFILFPLLSCQCVCVYNIFSILFLVQPSQHFLKVINYRPQPFLCEKNLYRQKWEHEGWCWPFNSFLSPWAHQISCILLNRAPKSKALCKNETTSHEALLACPQNLQVTYTEMTSTANKEGVLRAFRAVLSKRSSSLEIAASKRNSTAGSNQCFRENNCDTLWLANRTLS